MATRRDLPPLTITKQNCFPWVGSLLGGLSSFFLA